MDMGCWVYGMYDVYDCDLTCCSFVTSHILCDVLLASVMLTEPLAMTVVLQWWRAAFVVMAALLMWWLVWHVVSARCHAVSCQRMLGHRRA